MHINAAILNKLTYPEGDWIIPKQFDGPNNSIVLSERESNRKIRVSIFDDRLDGLTVNERKKRILLLQSIRQLGFLKLYNLEHFKDQVVIVHDDFNGIPLSEVIKSGTRIEQESVRKIMAQILATIECLHAKNLVHARIVPENILYNVTTGEVRVIGFVHLLEGTAWIEQSYRQERYLPPEFYLKNIYNFVSEIYSLGLILYELVNCERLLNHLEDNEVLSYLKAKDFKIPLTWPAQLSLELIHVLENSLAANPAERFNSIGEMRSALNSSRVKTSSDLSIDLISPKVCSSVKLIPLKIGKTLVDRPLYLFILTLMVIFLAILSINNFEFGLPEANDFKEIGINF